MTKSLKEPLKRLFNEVGGGGVIGCVLVGAGVVGDLAFSDCQWCSAAFSASSTFNIPFT